MKYIIANFKLNGDSRFILNYAKQISKLASSTNNMMIALPNCYLHFSNDFAKHKIQVGAQNVSEYISGSFTGEISANMIQDLGAKFVIVGHSERRHIFGETDQQIAAKVENLANTNLKTILCVGEKLEDKSRFKSVVGSQLRSALKNANYNNLIIAYEPVWAIGTGQTATLSDIIRVHEYIKEFVKKNYNVDIPVVYGGSVKPNNSIKILGLDCVDGVLVGGASLKPYDFSLIYNSQF